MPRMKDRITIKHAKEICKKKYGRLPRVGYTMTVEKGLIERTMYYPRTIHGMFRFETELENHGGTYKVWTWYAPFPEMWLNGKGPETGRIEITG